MKISHYHYLEDTYRERDPKRGGRSAWIRFCRATTGLRMRVLGETVDGHRAERLAGRIPVTTSWVYFIAAIQPTGDIVAVKIGRSRNPAARSDLLTTACPFPVRLLGVVSEQIVASERALHRHLTPWRLHNEWFQSSATVLCLIVAMIRHQCLEDAIRVLQGAE